MSIINLLSKVEYHLSQPRFRFFHSLYFNLRMLPFKQALKMPIYLYGPVKFYWLTGKIEINGDIKRGMIKLGRNFEFFNGVSKATFLLIQGRVIFDGPCQIGNNYVIRVAKDATLRFGKFAFFGSAIKVICVKNIEIGDYTRIAYESQLVDSNFHYTYNEKKNIVGLREKPIILGKYNWIGNRCNITKGTITKDYTIVSAGSMLNKDYTKQEEEHVFLAGTPAKYITSGLRRVFSHRIEAHLIDYFRNLPEAESCPLEEFEDETSSLEKQFE